MESITVITSDGTTHTIPLGCAMKSTLLSNLKSEIVSDESIQLPNVNKEMFSYIYSWMRDPNVSFTDMDIETLSDLMLAVNFMDINPLLDQLAEVVASRIRGKTPEEIRNVLGLEDDFTPEERELLRTEMEFVHLSQ